MTNYKKPLRAALMLSSALFISALAYGQDGEQAGEPSGAAEEADERRLGPVVVRGAFIPNEKRSTSEISSLIDAEDFLVTGASDAASALTRVTGISISRGKFVFVRGLNERYTSATLNGSILPSPEPLRRVAPLDLFPTAVLDSVLVQKTFSAQYSAEFGGGLIELRTKKIPDQGFFNIGVSGTISTETSFQDGVLNDGGGATDFLGIDDGSRFPDPLADVFLSGPLPSDPALISEIGAAITTPALTIVQEGLVGPDYSVNISGGQRWDINQNLSLGFTSAFTFAQDFETREGFRQNLEVAGDLLDGGTFALGLTEGDTFTREGTELNIKNSGLVSFGAEIFDTHEVGVTLFGTRSTSREVRVFEGFADDGFGNDVRFENFEFFERQLFTIQGNSSHEFPILGNLWNELDDFRIEIRGSYSEADRDAPAQTQIVFEEDGGIDNAIIDAPLTFEDSDDFSFTFSVLDDVTQDIGVDLILPLDLEWLPGHDVTIRAGYSYVDSERDSVVRDFNFSGGIPAAVGELAIPSIFNAATITGTPGFGTFDIDEVGGADAFPDAFAGGLEIDGYYGSIDAQITPYLRIAAGVRFENALQTSDTFDISTGLPPDDIIEAQLSSEFVLPSVTATWNFASNLQLRAAFSQTITRPQFRELALQQFVNSETDEDFFGNPFLINSFSNNVDARLEWYFADNQFITIGGFFKGIDDPIEEVGISAVDTRITGFINAPSAELFGFEVELQTEVPLHDWLGWDFLTGRDYIFAGNYTFTQSSVSAEGDVISINEFTGAAEFNEGTDFIIDGRPLVGQSDNLVNVQIGWDDPDAGAQFRLLLNYASERIRSAENLIGNQPAVIEQPPLSLDVTYNKDFEFLGGQYTLGFRAANLTGEDYFATQSDGTQTLVVDSFEIGQSFSLSLKRSF